MTATGCKKVPEMGDIKVKESVSVDKKAKYEETLKKEKDNLNFILKESLTKDNIELNSKLAKPIKDISNTSDVVKLPEDIKGLKKDINLLTEVTDEEAIMFAKIRKPVTPIEDESAVVNWGDAAYVITQTADLKTKESLDYLDISKQIRLGSEDVSDKLEEQIIGMKQGETKKVILNYPEDYYDRELQGKSVVTYVKVAQIARPNTPTEEEIKKARIEIKKIRKNNYETAVIEDIKKQLLEQTVITAYPKSVVKELREEYRNIYLNEKNIEQIKKNLKDLSEDVKEIKESEDLYVIEKIEPRLILLALSERTGINRESDSVKEYMRKNRIEDISDDELMNFIINKIIN